VLQRWKSAALSEAYLAFEELRKRGKHYAGEEEEVALRTREIAIREYRLLQGRKGETERHKKLLCRRAVYFGSALCSL